MIFVKPKESFVMKNPHWSDSNIQQAIENITTIIRGASPFIESIEFLNKTKGCNMDIVFNRGKITVTVTNPADEVFDLNVLENPIIKETSVIKDIIIK